MTPIPSRCDGQVQIKANVSNAERTRTQEIEFSVAPAASYMMIPKNIAKELALKPVNKAKVTLANKRQVEAGYALAYISLLGREAPVTVLVFDSPMPLLGSFTLQVLGMAVDPSKEELRPSRPFTLGMISTL